MTLTRNGLATGSGERRNFYNLRRSTLAPRIGGKSPPRPQELLQRAISQSDLFSNGFLGHFVHTNVCITSIGTVVTGEGVRWAFIASKENTCAESVRTQSCVPSTGLRQVSLITGLLYFIRNEGSVQLGEKGTGLGTPYRWTPVSSIQGINIYECHVMFGEASWPRGKRVQGRKVHNLRFAVALGNKIVN